MERDMMSIRTAADKWGVTTRRISQLCLSGEIKGAVKAGGVWKLPHDAPRPDVIRDKKRSPRVRTTRLLPCPVGITSYKEVSSECYYVDKTLLIKDIIDDHNKVMLFTRPRRFGKTLTMDMVKTYFEKTNEDTSVYFADRAIWSCDDSYKTYQGAYPVIFLSFKDAHQRTWSDMYESLSLSLRNEFKRHMDIMDNPAVSGIDKAYFGRMLQGTVSEVECQASLGQLSQILSAAYNSRVVVIIDEYDTPIQQGYSNGYYNEVIAFMRNLFSTALKDNEILEFSILTGILRVARESLFSGLNNLTVNTILDERYSEYFGFTSREVTEMADYYGQHNKLSELSEWYDGYLFGRSEIYNPWSVISYFNNNCCPKAFWSRTSSNDMILDIIQKSDAEIQNALMQLLQDRPVKATVDTDIIYPDIRSSEDTVCSFLMMTGYLKVAGIFTDLFDEPVCDLLIPNKEIKAVFKKEILDMLPTGMARTVIRDFRLALKTNNGDELEKALCRYLLQCASCFDTAHEDFYHGMMLGLLSIMSDNYLISSNRESGEGRFDIQLMPLSTSLPGILMEFKSSNDSDGDDLSRLAGMAIDQIKEKQYATDLRANGIKVIQLYGIAFCGKKATVKTSAI